MDDPSVDDLAWLLLKGGVSDGDRAEAQPRLSERARAWEKCVLHVAGRPLAETDCGLEVVRLAESLDAPVANGGSPASAPDVGDEALLRTLRSERT